MLTRLLAGTFSATKQKILDKAEVIARTVISQQAFYSSKECNKNHRQLLETMIGAAIWYLPTPAELYSGYTSVAALKQFAEAVDNTPIKLTKEHLYPRKVAARELFELDWSVITEPYLKVQELYLEKYGRFNFVMPKENKWLMKHQKADIFVSPEHSYAQAGVELFEVSYVALQTIRKGDQELARHLLSGGVEE